MLQFVLGEILGNSVMSIHPWRRTEFSREADAIENSGKMAGKQQTFRFLPPSSDFGATGAGATAFFG